MSAILSQSQYANALCPFNHINANDIITRKTGADTH